MIDFAVSVCLSRCTVRKRNNLATSVTLLEELPSMTTIVSQTRDNGVTLLDDCYILDDCYVLDTGK